MRASITDLEPIERRAWADMLRAGAPELRARLGAEVLERGGATVLRTAALDHPLFNRVFGIGVRREGVAALGSIVDGFRQRGISRYFVHAAHLRRDGVHEGLRALGLVRYRRPWLKLVRPSSPSELPATKLHVREVVDSRAGEAEALASIFCEGFDIPHVGAGLMEAVVGRENWQVWVVEDDDGRVAAMASMYVHESEAYLAGAATRDDFRGRGAQSALIAVRVQRALELGCRRISTETGQAVEGAANHSLRNLQRAGFRSVGLRDNYAPSDLRWDHGRAAAKERR